MALLFFFLFLFIVIVPGIFVYYLANNYFTDNMDLKKKYNKMTLINVSLFSVLYLIVRWPIFESLNINYKKIGIFLFYPSWNIILMIVLPLFFLAYFYKKGKRGLNLLLDLSVISALLINIVAFVYSLVITISFFV